MLSRALSKLRCPMCKGTLEVVAFEQESLHLDDQQRSTMRALAEERTVTVVKEGVLLCAHCKVYYPLSCYVPVMLVFKTAFHGRFADKHKAALLRVAGYGFPRWEAEDGERDTQQTFTEEWITLESDDLLWTFTKDELKLVHKKVFLKWPDEPPGNVRVILNVGVGFGTEAEALQEISGAEVFGVDLNFSLLQGGSVFLKKPAIHLIIASLFHLPFEEKSFDLVYSVGVLHHTYSTHDALRSISAFVEDGGHMFVWLYALEDLLIKKGVAGMLAKSFYLLQSISRPVLSRAPSWVRNPAILLLSVALHPVFALRVPHRGMWKFKNTNHNVRDSFTPRYYRYHSFNEVIEWFESLGFTCEVPSALTFKNLIGRSLDGVGVLGRKQPRV
jgi:ubiquinone/menaquinone biosynthesis C-methylase UbiE/uncharacterized protein YbaR (Trm112 family)